MQRIDSTDSEVAVFRFDWGMPWRIAGYALLVFGALAVVGSLALQQGQASDAAPENTWPASVGLLGLAGWALLRRTLRADRRARVLTLRRGVGPLGFTTTLPVDGIEAITVTRFARAHEGGATPIASAQRTRHEVRAQSRERSLLLARYFIDRTFDDSEPARFAETLAAFIGRPARLG